MYKQIATVITAVATASLLSSCTATGLFGQADQRHEATPKEEAPAPSAPDAGSEPTQTEVPAFHFASGDLILGDFDYEAIKDNLFNPCEEISETEFATVGLKRIEANFTVPGGGITCPLLGNEPGIGLAIGISPAGREDVEGQEGSAVRDADSSVIPGMMFYRGAESGDESCVAAVDTTRGQFSIVVGEATNPVSEQELCGKAQKIMEALYQL